MHSLVTIQRIKRPGKWQEKQYTESIYFLVLRERFQPMQESLIADKSTRIFQLGLVWFF